MTEPTTEAIKAVLTRLAERVEQRWPCTSSRSPASVVGSVIGRPRRLRRWRPSPRRLRRWRPPRWEVYTLGYLAVAAWTGRG